MTNFEKFKKEIINMIAKELATDGDIVCVKIIKCDPPCKQCKLNWLNSEVEE